MKTRAARHEAPVGMLRATFEQAHEAGCIQAETGGQRVMFYGLMQATRCNPCDGCPVWEESGPKCAAFLKYHTDHRSRRAPPTKVRMAPVPRVQTILRCPECGGRIRGLGHEQGDFHRLHSGKSRRSD